MLHITSRSASLNRQVFHEGLSTLAQIFFLKSYSDSGVEIRSRYFVGNFVSVCSEPHYDTCVTHIFESIDCVSVELVVSCMSMNCKSN